jgi:hypothetical protein
MRPLGRLPAPLGACELAKADGLRPFWENEELPVVRADE